VATLHVRNVPDSLYELLRECAEREGRSIGAQTVTLLQRAFDERELKAAHVRRAVSRRRSPFLKRFAESARELVLRAQELARETDSSHVTPGHVLLAMLEDDVLRPTLERSRVTAEDVRRSLARDGAPAGVIPFAADTKQVLEHALRRSLATKAEAVGTEHLLFALEAQPGLAGPATGPVESYLAVTLEGDWTEQLNELAGEGWQLFSVTPVGAEVRAVLRR
jgi:plasmid stability protein